MHSPLKSNNCIYIYTHIYIYLQLFIVAFIYLRGCAHGRAAQAEALADAAFIMLLQAAATAAANGARARATSHDRVSCRLLIAGTHGFGAGGSRMSKP